MISLLIGVTWIAPAAAAPNVVVSIAPVHSLVAAVMRGVASPDLLVPAGASPHAYALRPSEVSGLHAADMVIWIGGPLERFLVKSLATLDQTIARMTIMKLPAIKLLSVRRGDGWSDADYAQAGRGRVIDPHLWLDPDNARVIVTQVANQLARLDPANAPRYKHNARLALKRLAKLDARLKQKLAPVRNVHYVVFHDAYQYFETHYNLHPVGSITTNPEISPGARRIIEIREIIATKDVRCVFSEPQFTPALVRTVLEGTGGRHGVLDPEGAQIQPGPDAYITLMKRLADSLTECLTTGNSADR